MSEGTEALERVLQRVAERRARTAAAAPAAPAAPAPAPAPAPPAPAPPPAPPAPTNQDPRVDDLLVRVDDMERAVSDLKTEWDAEKEREVEEAMAEMDSWGDPEGGPVAIPEQFVAAVEEDHRAFLASLDDTDVALPPLTAASWTKGDDGKFTGSEGGGGLGPKDGTHAAHRDGQGHTDSRIHRNIDESIQAMKNSSVTSRSAEFTHNGETRTMEMSNVRETTRPDTMNSEIAPMIHQAADNPKGAELDRPIVRNGWAVDVTVGPAGKPTNPASDPEPGIRNSMMAAADAP